MSDQDNSTVDVDTSLHQNEDNVVPKTEVTDASSPTGVVEEEVQKSLRLRKPITYEELSDDELEPWMDEEKLKKAEDIDTDDLLSDSSTNKKFTRGKAGANGRASNRQRKKKHHFDDTDGNSDDAFDGNKRKSSAKRKPAAKKSNGKGKALEPMINIADLIKATSKPVSSSVP
jgi:hypothetical protein